VARLQNSAETSLAPLHAMASNGAGQRPSTALRFTEFHNERVLGRDVNSPTYLKGLLRDASLLRHPSCARERKQGRREDVSIRRRAPWARGPRGGVGTTPTLPPDSGEEMCARACSMIHSPRALRGRRTTTFDVHRLTFACWKLFCPMAWSIACSSATERSRELSFNFQFNFGRIWAFLFSFHPLTR